MKPSDTENGGSAVPTHPPRGIRIVAVLVVLMSTCILFSEVTGDGLTDSWATSLRADPVLAILKLASIGIGGAVAVGLWSANRWALWPYLIWMLLYVSVALVSESRVEPVIWKVAVGVALVSMFPLFGAVYLYRRIP